jgi:DNA-binding GntR family transcriptional regulator
MEIENNEQRKVIYDELKSKIINKVLTRGTRLVASKIASEYNVNKIHVNSVFQALLSEGLVEHISMKGYVVIGLNNDDMLEIAKIREMLELAIFDNFFDKADSTDIEEVKRLVKRKVLFLENDLKEDAVQETKDFFDKVYQRSTYNRIVQMLQQYAEYINLMINESFELPEDLEKSIVNSKLLYEALDKRSHDDIVLWIRNRYDNLVDRITNQ